MPFADSRGEVYRTRLCGVLSKHFGNVWNDFTSDSPELNLEGIFLFCVSPLFIPLGYLASFDKRNRYDLDFVYLERVGGSLPSRQ